MDFHPKKALGQHFLRDRSVVQALIRAAEIEPGETILEIGGGTGVLTTSLADIGTRLVVVEVDPGLAQGLKEQFRGRGQVEIHCADILGMDLAQVTSRPLVLLGNLPYRITTPILTWAVAQKRLIKRAVLMLQKEVGERLVAAPGTRAYGRLSVLVQYHATARVIRRVSPKCFFPRPKVESVIVRLDPRETPAVRVGDEAFFFRVVEASFNERRKMVVNALSTGRFAVADKGCLRETLAAVGIEATRRGETLSLQEFAGLANRLVEGAASGAKA